VILTLPLNLSLADAMLRVWVGNPISVVLQMLGIMLLTPHIVRLVAPGLISEEMNEFLEGSHAKAALPGHEGREGREGMETTPMGGFIQVFSFEELQSILRKSVGMEGFILYSSEGLVVWKDMPIRLDLEALISRVQTISDQLGKTVEDMGLSRARKVVIESREHYIFNTRLNSNFGLIMIFSSAVKLEECWPRLGVMAKTVREFLQWKYSGLASLSTSPATAQRSE
jgi:predicted regulator of Ras-like GTPase activity (Roadblock/LC7/MglB family)